MRPAASTNVRTHQSRLVVATHGCSQHIVVHRTGVVYDAFSLATGVERPDELPYDFLNVRI